MNNNPLYNVYGNAIAVNYMNNKGFTTALIVLLIGMGSPEGE
jgi:hypothetical protein